LENNWKRKKRRSLPSAESGDIRQRISKKIKKTLPTIESGALGKHLKKITTIVE
jgi:hypothetical protein